MKLLNCHIENFGKLNDFDIDFADGINTICENNGYGKSTLAAFFSIMFYGFDNKKATRSINDERMRYTPWQGGNYGGSITFETNQKRYILTRNFGKKLSEDKFELRDADTLLVSNDFDTNIGEQIFGIDKESFKRSIMISQNDCETIATDGINSKLGNVSENTLDMNNFENVVKEFDSLLNKYSSTKKTGEIYKLNSQIYDLEYNLENKDVVQDSFDKTKNLLENEKIKLEELIVSNEDIKKKIEDERTNDILYIQQEAYVNAKSKLENYDYQYKEAYERLSVKNIDDVFEASPVSDIDLVNTSKKINELNNLSIKRENESIKFEDLEKQKKLEKLFSVSEKPREELKYIQSKIDEYIDTDRKLSSVNDQMEISGDIINPSSFNGKLIFSIIGCIIGAAIAAVAFMMDYSEKNIFIINEKNYSQIAIVIGAIIFLIFIVSSIIVFSKKKRETEKYNSYKKLMTLKDNYEKNLIDNERIISKATVKYNIRFDKYDIGRNIARLIDEYDIYTELTRKKIDSENSREAKLIKDIKFELDLFFSKYLTIINGTSYLEKLTDLRNKLDEYHLYAGKKEKFNEAKREVLQIESSDGFDKIKKAHKPIGDNEVKLLDEKYNDNELLIEKCTNNCKEYEDKLTVIRETLDELTDNEELLVSLKEKREELTEKARLLALTKDFLGEAKISFASKYREQILIYFNKYYMAIDGSENENYSFDANTKLIVSSDGYFRNIANFSRGKRDLAGLAFRLALIEAMYTKEHPFLILDDPFVNLDDDKIKNALDLIKNISKEYQVIYFTCSNTRFLDGQI